MAKPQPAYQCTECGWRALKWVGRCGECQQWGTVIELAGEGSAKTARTVLPSAGREAKPITQLTGKSVTHESSGVHEFDRVLGGGIVPGAAILLSGEPGVGKSTLLLEVASKTAATGKRVLYVSAEESVDQVRMRAERTHALHDELFLASESDLGVVLGQIESVQPGLVIVDSVQTIANAELDGAAGGPSQVREVATTLIRLAKNMGVPVVLVGHVTKDGSIAGPRMLEHLVDVVCHFEGDRQSQLRFVRSIKNRFGPTDEVGCFEMTGDGIREVADPSGLFMSRNDNAVSGTCVTIAMEGRRALAVEVQALVVASATPNPRRVTSGVDSARVAMILAVLERRIGVPLHASDVYVSTVGGVRLTEPAADLAIALAIMSAASDQTLSPQLVAFGEISLAGEVRPVTASEHRAQEAKRMGFTSTIDARTETLANARQHAFATGS
jgi:DNA repair protein RadA/Sms